MNLLFNKKNVFDYILNYFILWNLISTIYPFKFSQVYKIFFTSF
jgi:hypothetical protein